MTRKNAPLPLRSATSARSHDYRFLIQRWKKVARGLGVSLARFASSGGFPLYCLDRRIGEHAPSLYLSAGIHGDEPAGVEALVQWVGGNVRLLRGVNLLLFPCLNPWGLTENSRFDKQHRDLNRTYHGKGVRQTAAQLRLIGSRRLDLAVTLHEDFDGRGMYVYELPAGRRHWGERLIAAAAPFVPPETRTLIDGRRCRNGVIRARLNADVRRLHPEAIIVHLRNGAHSVTSETPSEFHIDDRVAAHCAMLDEALCLLGGGG